MKRTPREFKIGYKVFLRVKLGKSFKKSSKLVARFIGPFDILQIINPINYHLELPASSSKLHNMFYVSLLNKYVPNPSHVLDVENLLMIDPLIIELKPLKVLETHTKTLQNHEFEQCKV